MRERWRKTLELLKAHPILLLPLVGVSLADFYLEWLQKIAIHRYVQWFVTAHSALGFAIPDSGTYYERAKQALAIALPVGLCIRVLIFSAYVAGFVLTARMVRNLVEEEHLGWASAVRFLRARLLRVLLLAMTILVIFSLAMVLFSALLDVRMFAFLRADISFTALISTSVFLVYVCIAWVMIPMSLRLIADRPSEPIPLNSKTEGRIAAIAAAGVSVFLIYCVTNATLSINRAFEVDAWLRSLLIWPGISVLENIPLALLWVFLALIADQESQIPEIPSPS